MGESHATNASARMHWPDRSGTMDGGASRPEREGAVRAGILASVLNKPGRPTKFVIRE
jgi:hypothetical protein